MKSLRLAVVLVLAVVSAFAGCGPTEINVSKKSSYSDLVVTYNAELETLEKLEAKRKAAIADYFSQAQAQAIEAAINSASAGGIPSNPNQALDRAVAAAETQAQLHSGLAGSLGLKPDSEEAVANYPEELKNQLAELDAEIADQKLRVQRAKEARDAAQPK